MEQLADNRPHRATRGSRGALAMVVVLLAAFLAVASPATAAPTAAVAGVSGCESGAPERVYDVSAIDVRIQYNRWGYNDPGGFMYVLDSEIDAVRAQESSRQVSSGLGDDAIQPLVVRANLGECLVVNLTNRLAGDGAPAVSFHALGLAYDTTAPGDAVGDNPGSLVAPGASATYRLYLDPAAGEASYVFHSGGDARQLTSHGLFGAIVAEPAGSAYLHPETGEPLASGWHAMIQPAEGPAFREFVPIYHEVGDEAFQLLEADGDLVNMNDSSNPANLSAGATGSGAYRPGARAINYRSEPFLERMNAIPSSQPTEKSQLYGTYAFGDPATPIMRSYLGEPTKTRLVNGGSEMAHVHHLHGGATRWVRNPGADDTDFGSGLNKTPAPNTDSVRLDSQTVSPGETFSLEHECGAGGCQQAAGDFLYHCHIAQHYTAGMWSMWRVYDTAQPDLAALPDRAASPAAVNSAGLIGKVIEGKTVVPASQLTDPATQRSLESWVEGQLPPKGARSTWDDATVWDWAKEGTASAPVYKGEPDDTRTWANYASASPGARPEIGFNPVNGRYAWPLLRPHLATRPPFAPNGHGGAPGLGATASATRPDGLCPAGAPVRTYNVTAVNVPIQEVPSDTQADVTDENGQVFVLNEDKDAVLAGTKPAEPLVIRSNVGDCVALTLSSELDPTQENHEYPKVNMHTHFVQFDPQGSDGVTTGNAYEQSVKPYSSEDRTLTAAAAAGASTLTVSNATGLRPGVAVAVGQGEASIEVRKLTNVTSTGGSGPNCRRRCTPPTVTLTLDQPLAKAHAAGEPVGVEFVQYRWYSDVDSGTAFWHDHVDGANSWDHGLFGAMIIEPQGSTYHDPATGAEVRSGAIADIHTTGSVAAGHSGSFREFVALVHDGMRFDPNADNLPNGAIFRHQGSINLRAEPLSTRGGAEDPNKFSSVTHGDPITPLWRAYAGDPVMVRTLGIVELEASLRITGHRFRPELFAPESELVDAQTVGISERYDLMLDGGAGGPAGSAGDYLYYSAGRDATEAGAWGLFRVHDTTRPDLKPLPGRAAPPSGDGFPSLTETGAAPPEASGPGDPCPSGAPARHYDVAAFAKALPVPNNPQPIQVLSLDGQRVLFTIPAPAADPQDDDGVVLSLAADRQAILDGSKPLEPLVLRANSGDCVEVSLTNHLDGGRRAGLNFAKLLFDPQGSYGAAVGLNPDSTVAPGGTRTYRYFADRELGTTIGVDLSHPERQVHGAYATLVVEPEGSTYHNSATNAPLASGTQAIIRAPGGAFREHVAVIHDAESLIGDNDGRYFLEVSDFAALNYHVEPFAPRLEDDSDPAEVYSSRAHGDPATTLMEAYAGDPVRFRVAVPAAGQFHTFQLDGHDWPSDPALAGANVVGSETIGPGQSIDVHTTAGGRGGYSGDYLYRDHRFPFTEAGLWGVYRVYATTRPGLAPL